MIKVKTSDMEIEFDSYKDFKKYMEEAKLKDLKDEDNKIDDWNSWKWWWEYHEWGSPPNGTTWIIPDHWKVTTYLI